jgi:hypothetical protein
MEIFTKNSAKCTIFQRNDCNNFSSLMADKDFYISNTFPKCGLDFRVKDWDKETPEEFKKHLDVLHEEQFLSISNRSS